MGIRVRIKLYGHLVYQNENRFTLEIAQGAALYEVHKLIFENPSDNLVSIVDGHAQKPDYIIDHNCSISIFPPMSGRIDEPFIKI